MVHSVQLIVLHSVCCIMFDCLSENCHLKKFNLCAFVIDIALYPINDPIAYRSCKLEDAFTAAYHMYICKHNA